MKDGGLSAVELEAETMVAPRNDEAKRQVVRCR